MIYATAIALWALALLPVATTIGRIPHADRDCDSEESAREPIAERPTQILVISNHGADIYDAVQ